MSVSVLASTSACLGTVGLTLPGTLSFNPTSSATLLVVAVGWSSAGTLSEPTVTFNNETMILKTGFVEWDSATGAVAFYYLPLVNPTSGTIVVQPSGFIGNTQIAAFAYTGTNQSLGQCVVDEYGTNSSPVSLGTTNINGVSVGSVFSFVGMTFFGGTPAAMVTTGGWTNVTQSTAANEGVYLFYTTNTGNISITAMSSPSTSFNMLCVGWEVLQGSPATGGSGVNLVAHTSALLGVVSSANPGSLTFDPTTAANYLVATVGWASSSPLTPPSVSFGGQIMHIVTSPIEVDNGFGAVAIYVLPLNSASSQTVVVSSTPNFAGYTSIVLCAYSNTSQQLGVIIPSEFGTNGSGVFSGTTNFTGVSNGSTVNFTACTFFGSSPTSLTYSAGWQNIAGSGATNQSVWSYNWEYQNQSSFSITLSNALNQFNTLNIGYEVLVAGTPHPQPSVNVTASNIFYLGQIGLNPTSVTFDANGASVLVVCAARTNNFATPASFTFGDLPLTFLSSPAVNDPTVGGSMDILVLANPASGPQLLTGEGPVGYFGDTVVLVVGLSNLSGVGGIKGSYSGSGDSANVVLPPCKQTGSLVLGFVASPITFNVEVPNYGWTQVAVNNGAFMDTYVFSALGSSTLSLYLTNSGFAKTQALVLEFEKALSVIPDETGTGSAAVSSFTSTGAGTFTSKLTPSGQTFQIYWDSWLDQPLKDVADMMPDDFYLAHIPSYISAVSLSFAIPQCTYAGLSSNIKETTGLNFPGSVTLLADTIALLKTRNPNIKVYVAVQQNTPEQAYPNPYMMESPGWGGMTLTHVQNLKQFLIDTGCDGVVIDYECLDTNAAPSFHCTYTSEGIPTCYTDTEFVSVVKLMRQGLPRPITIIVDGFSVGAYVGQYYFKGLPFGYNSGYAYCISQDAEALAAIDGIHMESYDAGDQYDPRVALRSFLDLFPGVPVWVGLRVGPLQYQNVKQTVFNFIDYCNTSIMYGSAGVHMYSMLWDAIPPPGLDNPLASGAPFGNYSPEFPNANICATAVAETFNLPDANLLLVNKPTTSGLKGPGLGV